MNLFNIFSSIFSKIPEAISSVVKARLSVKEKAITSQADVLVADAKGESWMQRTWRPALGYILALVLFLELFFVRFVNIYYDMTGNFREIEYRQLPIEFWYLIISVATVFGGARTGRYLMKARRQELALEKASLDNKVKEAKTDDIVDRITSNTKKRSDKRNRSKKGK